MATPRRGLFRPGTAPLENAAAASEVDPALIAAWGAAPPAAPAGAPPAGVMDVDGAAPAPPAAPPPLDGTYFPNKARADGIHDFGVGSGPKIANPNNDAFTHGVIGSDVRVQLDEDEAMDAAFEGNDLPHARDMWEALAERTSRVLPSVRTGHVYSVKKVPFKLPDGTWNVGRALIDDLGIGDNTAVLQIDFNHHGFLQKLTQGPAIDGADAVTIGYVWSAATVNDPASKTPPTDAIFRRAHPNGVTLVAHRQTSGVTSFKKPDGTYYSATDPTANFVSEYDVELSGIIAKESFGGRRGKDSVSLKFTIGSNVSEIDDSKGQNSPNALLEFINKLLGRDLTPKSKFEISSKWQQKRSGDWLQAIHAAILPKLALNPGLPANATPYFVSHDGIAISYALEMGVNCLFFSGNEIYAFAKAGATTAEQIAACVGTKGSVPLEDFTAVVSWFNTISANKRQRLDILSGLCRANLAIIADFITKAGGGAAGIMPQQLSGLETSIRNALQAAVRYTFMEKLLPDDARLIGELKNTANPCVQVNAYRTLQRLYDQHNREPNIPETIIGTIDRAAAGKAVRNWKIEQTLVSRLIGGLVQNENRDAYIFLPYIQNSADAALKNEIARTFQGLHRWLHNTPDLQPVFRDNPGPNRQKRIRMALDSLLSQITIFLKTVGTGGAGVAAGAGPDADDITLFTDSLVVIPDAPAVANDPVQDTRNLLKVDKAVESYTFRQTEPDEEEEEAAAPAEAPAEGLAKKPKIGGWRDNQRFFTVFSIDSLQCAEPLLYAHIDANVSVFTAIGAIAAEDIRLNPPRRVGGRRPLYGGREDPVPAKRDGESARDVIYIYTLIGLMRVMRDVWKLRGAPSDVLEYYTRCTAFMLLVLVELPQTPENALALHDLMAHCAFMNNEDFAKAFSLDADTSGVYRMFFSALEENPPRIPPVAPAKYLIEAKDTFASLWHSIPDIELDAAYIQVMALEGIARIRKVYGLS